MNKIITVEESEKLKENSPWINLINASIIMVCGNTSQLENTQQVIIPFLKTTYDDKELRGKIENHCINSGWHVTWLQSKCNPDYMKLVLQPNNGTNSSETIFLNETIRFISVAPTCSYLHVVKTED